MPPAEILKYCRLWNLNKVVIHSEKQWIPLWFIKRDPIWTKYNDEHKIAPWKSNSNKETSGLRFYCPCTVPGRGQGLERAGRTTAGGSVTVSKTLRSPSCAQLKRAGASPRFGTLNGSRILTKAQHLRGTEQGRPVARPRTRKRVPRRRRESALPASSSYVWGS